MLLRDYPFDRVRLACEKCERNGSYRKAALVKQYGATIELPAMLGEIAADCPRQGLNSVGMDPCGVIYPDLKSAFARR
jgi:hypothetical protein